MKICCIHCINGMKDKKKHIISVDAEEAFNKIDSLASFHDKNLINSV